MSERDERHELNVQGDILTVLKEIRAYVQTNAAEVAITNKLLKLLLYPVPRELEIFQLKTGDDMAITGSVPGTTSTFQETPSAPPNAVEPAGTTTVWTSSDTANTTLTPNGNKVAVAVGSAAPVGGSYVLTATDTFPDGTTATGSATVPYLAPPTPEPTALQINQLS